MTAVCLFTCVNTGHIQWAITGNIQEMREVLSLWAATRDILGNSVCLVMRRLWILGWRTEAQSDQKLSPPFKARGPLRSCLCAALLTSFSFPYQRGIHHFTGSTPALPAWCSGWFLSLLGSAVSSAHRHIRVLGTISSAWFSGSSPSPQGMKPSFSGS